MGVGWPSDYPSAAAIRQEAEAMAAALTEVLLESIPSYDLAGIYLKGSAQKRWDSVLDYVPEISDVDVHVLFRDEECIERTLGTSDAALAVRSRIEKVYRDKVASPLHLPRPQLVVLNRLLHDPDYSPSPPQTVVTLWGEAYPEATYDEERERDLSRRMLLADAEILQVLPLRILDKPGPYLLSAIRDLTWRVSPTGSRVLCLRGMPSAEAWSLNRTSIVAALAELREDDLASAYQDFYLSAWRCFLSRYADSTAMRNTVAAGCEVLRTAVKMAE